jgi:hypothetical protein
MNYKLMIFSGIITASIGAIAGLAAAQIGQRDFDRLKYESLYYQNLHEKYALIGGSLGLILGIGQECIRELKSQRKD